MASLTALPTEIILAIVEPLSHSDIKSLSCMDRRLRNAVTHIIFRTLSIAMPLVSHLMLDHMLKKYERFISKIHLHVFLRPNLEEDGNRMPSIGGTMKSDTLLQLVNGKIFSHINSFSIHFDPCQFDIGAGHWYGNDGDWGGGYGSGSITVFEDGEQELACHEYEKEHVWRAQYMQVLAEIMQNPNIQKLRIENLLPRRTSVFDTWEWEKFLGQITHLGLSIFGAECAGWSVNTMPGFLQFMDDVLPKDIMKYLINLKHLRLEASELSVVGPGVDGGRIFAPRGHIGPLESLEVKNMVLGFTFQSFLGRQRDGLRELTLHNCMCLAITEPQSLNWSDDEPDEIQWSDIWACVVVSCPAMRKVTYLQDERPPLPVTVEEDILEGCDDLMVWRHVLIDEQWGTVEENEEANHAEVCLNHSCAAYDEMMKVLAERREKDKSSPDAEATEAK